MTIVCPYPGNFGLPIIIRRWKRRYIYIGHVRRLWTLFPVLNETLRYAIAIIVGCGFPYDTRRCDGQDSYVIRFLIRRISAQIRRLCTDRGRPQKDYGASQRLHEQMSEISFNDDKEKRRGQFCRSYTSACLISPLIRSICVYRLRLAFLFSTKTQRSRLFNFQLPQGTPYSVKVINCIHETSL